MNLTRHAKVCISALLIVCALATLPIGASAENAENLEVTLSNTNLLAGDKLTVFIKYNTTAWWIRYNATVILSHISTGEIYAMSQVNLSYDGRANWTVELHRPIAFGDYLVWVRVGNISVFKDIMVQPSIFDLWDLNKRSAEESATTQRLAERAIFVAFILPTFGVGAAILFSYWMWRIPSPEKDELANWFLSKWDLHKLSKLVKDIRDLDRRSYARRRAPSVMEAEKEIAMLQRKRRALLELAESIKAREDKLKTRSKLVEEYRSDLEGTAKDLEERIGHYEETIEDQLETIQVKALEKNRKRLRDPTLGKRDMEAVRLRRMLERKGSG